MARSRRTTASMANANGFILQCNLSKELTRKIAKSSPVIIGSGKSGYNRNIRHIVLNIAELTSDAILEELRIELQKKLKRRGITADTKLSNAEWVVAAPNNRARCGGVKHRDVKNRQPGYLTVILFLGDRESDGYGTVKIWRNSQTFLEGHTFIPNDKGIFKNSKRKLGRCDEAERGGGECGFDFCPQKFNVAIFDSRLWHQSQPHSSPHAHRVSLTCFLTLKEGILQAPPPPNTTYYLQKSEWRVADLSKHI